MVVLASQSPRRAEILTAAGIPFVVRKPEIDEQRRPGETPEEYVRRLALEKAQAVRLGESEIVLGADTVVVLDGAVLEKPQDHQDAAGMLQALSGKRHEVLTGICLRSAGRTVIDAASTAVSFLPLDPEEISGYVRSGEPMDKAGAYAIQGLASRFVDRIEGCYFNVVGLPISLVYRHLKQLQ